MRRTREEWADDHGYSRYRCPTCHYTFWTDSAVTCPYCSEGEEETTEQPEDQEAGSE